MLRKRTIAVLTGATVVMALVPWRAEADQVILDDLIVDGSICAGFDCVNGESFGFDTIRIKENNLRIRAQDTSTSASFPTRDWQITFNDSSNGGAEKFAIDDIDGGRTPFTITAGARANSIFVNSAGRVGFGTNSPVVDLHVVSGNTPTLRLEQNGSSGFTPQTWDVAGNEAGFFIRDTTNGSKLSFRIRPGAPTSSIDIQADGDVGLGTTTPDGPLHVAGTAGTAIFETDGNDNGASPSANIGLLVRNKNIAIAAGRAEASLVSENGDDWRFQNNNLGSFVFTKAGTGDPEMVLSTAGDLNLNGDCIQFGDEEDSQFRITVTAAGAVTAVAGSC